MRSHKVLTGLLVISVLLIVWAVWKAPHWHYLNIHDATAFRFVELLGAFQTAAAIYAAYLAVPALPAERQTFHYFSFAFLGWILFGLTFAVGIVNDKAQFDLGNKLGFANDALTNIRVAMSKSPCPPNSQTVSYVTQVLQYTTSRAGSAVQPSTVPAPPAPTVMTYPLAPTYPHGGPDDLTPHTTVSTTKASVNQEIVRENDRLNDTATRYQGKMAQMMSSVRAMAIQHASQEAQQTAFQSVWPQLENSLEVRKSEFERQLPSLSQTRADALQLLQLSPAELASDQKAFNNAVAKSEEIPVRPNSWWQAGFLYTLQFNAMGMYLGSLQTKLDRLP